jgi:hypothetical protein
MNYQQLSDRVREALFGSLAPEPGIAHAGDLHAAEHFEAARTIRAARIHAEMTQAEFAACLGITVAELRLLELGDAYLLCVQRACRRVFGGHTEH